MMNRTCATVLVAFLGFFICCTSPSRAGRQDKDAWGPLRFLVGTWTGRGSGKPGEATSAVASFAFDLDKQILVRKNRAEFAPKPGEKKAEVHEDLMVIYPAPGSSGFRAVYFDNEGHVINYTISFPGKKSSAVLESEASDKAPRFRLVYEPGPDGALNNEFLIAPPGGTFKSYVKGTMKKAR